MLCDLVEMVKFGRKRLRNALLWLNMLTKIAKQTLSACLFHTRRGLIREWLLAKVWEEFIPATSNYTVLVHVPSNTNVKLECCWATHTDRFLRLPVDAMRWQKQLANRKLKCWTFGPLQANPHRHKSCVNSAKLNRSPQRQRGESSCRHCYLLPCKLWRILCTHSSFAETSSGCAVTTLRGWALTLGHMIIVSVEGSSFLLSCSLLFVQAKEAVTQKA